MITQFNNEDSELLLEAKFDSFLNKTIIYSSKKYFKKQMKLELSEEKIIDDANYETYLENIIAQDDTSKLIDEFIDNSELYYALNSLSIIEQYVIRLTFQDNFSQEEASKILMICSKSISRIKRRALKKLRDYLEKKE